LGVDDARRGRAAGSLGDRVGRGRRTDGGGGLEIFAELGSNIGKTYGHPVSAGRFSPHSSFSKPRAASDIVPNPALFVTLSREQDPEPGR
jgi:hypothetical protein